MLRFSMLLLVLFAAAACERPAVRPRTAPASAPAHAADAVSAPEAGPHQTVLIGQSRIVPDAIDIGPSTTVDFQNQSFSAMTIRFTAPKNMKSMLTGSHVERAGKAPWLVFYWDSADRLVASVDPGRIGSLCCFAPGNYSFTVSPTFPGTPEQSGVLGNEGTITVK